MDDILKLLLISDWWREVSRGESRAVIGQNKTGVSEAAGNGGKYSC